MTLAHWNNGKCTNRRTDLDGQEQRSRCTRRRSPGPKDAPLHAECERSRAGSYVDAAKFQNLKTSTYLLEVRVYQSQSVNGINYIPGVLGQSSSLEREDHSCCRQSSYQWSYILRLCHEQRAQLLPVRSEVDKIWVTQNKIKHILVFSNLHSTRYKPERQNRNSLTLRWPPDSTRWSVWRKLRLHCCSRNGFELQTSCTSVPLDQAVHKSPKYWLVDRTALRQNDRRVISGLFNQQGGVQAKSFQISNNCATHAAITQIKDPGSKCLFE